MDHFAVFANEELQIIAHDPAQARLEMKDLRKMECENVVCYHVSGKYPNVAVDNMDDTKREGKSLGVKTLAKIAEACEVTIVKFK